jgi:hypothetical protein
MAWTEAPEMQIGKFVTLDFDRLADLVGHLTVWVHIQQNCTRVPDQAVRPTCNDGGADDTRERIHPEPAKGASEQQSDNNEH